MKKTYNNRKDFIETLCSMTDVEINDFIKKNGKPPKMVVMCRIVDKKIK